MVGMALMIAVGVTEDGQRTVLGVELGCTEDGEHWRSFLRSLRARGLCGVRLVVSDSHQGLIGAVRSEFVGAVWQRCTVHFTRNVVAQVPKHDQPAISAVVRQIFAQPDRQTAHEQLSRSIVMVQERFPRVADMLAEAEPDILAHMDFPAPHWCQIRSTNSLERLNREVARRIDVVGIFPNRASVLRLIGALLAEQDDEWATSRRYFSIESMAAVITPSVPAPVDPTPTLSADTREVVLG